MGSKLTGGEEEQQVIRKELRGDLSQGRRLEVVGAGQEQQEGPCCPLLRAGGWRRLGGG